MASKRHETIVFSKKERESKAELFERVGEQLKLLLEAGYIAVVRYDEPGIGVIVIEYQHDENLDYWGCAAPIWLTPEERESVKWDDDAQDEID